MNIQNFTRELIKEAGVASFAKTLGGGISDFARKNFRNTARAASGAKDYLLGGGSKAVKSGSKGPIGKRIKDYLHSATLGEKGAVGKNVRQAGKDLVKHPWKTIKKGWNEMDNTEKFVMPILSYDASKDALGKLKPGETRLVRMGEHAGRLAGYYATPFKRVGMLGNIMLGDVIGATAGRYAGKGISKLKNVGEKAGYSLAHKLNKK